MCPAHTIGAHNTEQLAFLQCSFGQWFFSSFIPTARFTENTRDQQSLIAYTSGIINCSAEGTPLPQITWGKQGEKLVPNGRRFAQIPSGSLHIDLVHPEDGGTYRCTITQNKGSKRFTIKAKNISVSVIGE